MKTDLNGVIVSNYKKDNSIVFIDLSVYNDMLPVDEPSLLVTPPFLQYPIPLNYNSNGNTIITAVDLDISNNLVSLPCGIYKFKQSICPHVYLFHEFWYVHVDSIKRKIAKLYCDGKINEAKEIDSKLIAIDALSMCMDCDAEKKINIILDSLDCSIVNCNYQQPKNKILKLELNSESCNKCNKCNKCNNVCNCH